MSQPHLFKNFYMLKFLLVSIISSLSFCKSESSDGMESLALIQLLNSNTTTTARQSNPCPPANLPEDVYIANEVISAPGKGERNFGNPDLAIQGVCGGGQFSGSFHVYELLNSGSGAELVLGWKDRVVENVTGVDFIVFENAFQNQGSDNTFFVEPIVVEVGNDLVNYCGFSPNFSNGTTATQLRDDWQNFAGLTPSLYNMATNPIPAQELFDNPIKQTGAGNTYYMGKAGGDGFDLASDNFGTGTTTGTCNSTLRDSIRSDGFRYMKLIAAPARGFPSPIGAFGNGSSDIDGVIARSVKPL
ncbi:MAG: LIC_13355 family lipoprotein [Leptospira sp.]|nr:LIC_13355 family lipoprotein [Leptospira sp.]